MKLFVADTNSGMIRKISDWFAKNFNPNKFGQSELISINSKLQSERIPKKHNETEIFGIIRIDSDILDSFGLKVRIDQIDWIHRIWKFGLIRM